METIYLKIKVKKSNKILNNIRNEGLFFSNIADAISVDSDDIKEIEVKSKQIKKKV